MTARTPRRTPTARERLTRVFRNKAGTFCVSVQVSFVDYERADRFARALDELKALAACERITFSAKLAAILGHKGGKR